MSQPETQPASGWPSFARGEPLNRLISKRPTSTALPDYIPPPQ